MSNRSMVTKFNDLLNWTHSVSDSRTKGWLMVDSPIPTLSYTALYLLIAYIGPRIMKYRKPLILRQALIPYNLSMAILNLYIAIELLFATTRLNYNFNCQPITYHKEELRIANAIWLYYFSKLLEFSDTIFFILRKKNRQLTFLHVYHHSTMFFIYWIVIKWAPGGSAFLPVMVNSFIHVLMYSYYGLAAMGGRLSKYLWWKKYLTMLQMIQFTTLIIVAINGIRIGCKFTLWLQYLTVFYAMSFIILFGNFYAKAYFEQKNDFIQELRPSSTSGKKWE